MSHQPPETEAAHIGSPLSWFRQHRLKIIIAVVFLLGVMVWRGQDRQLSSGCVGQLVLVDEAITHWAIEKQRNQVDAPTGLDLKPYVRNADLLHCPQGGTYRFGSLVLATQCSQHGAARLTNPEPALAERDKVSDKICRFFGIMVRRIPRKHLCIANLKQIDGAVQQWALEFKQPSDSGVDAAQLLLFMKGRTLQQCSAGGKYVIGRVANAPYCTIESHSF